MLTSSSPWLFAGCHVLHRQSVPGHPPCALISLITFQKVCRPLLKCCLLPLIPWSCLIFAVPSLRTSPLRSNPSALPSFALISLSRSLALCSCQGAYFAIPENDIVQTFLQVQQSALVPVSLRLSSLCSILLSCSQMFALALILESTSGYEVRQDFMSP